MEPVLQVALDFADLERALRLAREAVGGGADWIEIGTPRIKSEGLDAVRRFRAEFPQQTLGDGPPDSPRTAGYGRNLSGKCFHPSDLTAPARSPSQVNSGAVCRKRLVGRQQDEFFDLRLRDQHPIERIAVAPREQRDLPWVRGQQWQALE